MRKPLKLQQTRHTLKERMLHTKDRALCRVETWCWARWPRRRWASTCAEPRTWPLSGRLHKSTLGFTVRAWIWFFGYYCTIFKIGVKSNYAGSNPDILQILSVQEYILSWSCGSKKDLIKPSLVSKQCRRASLALTDHGKRSARKEAAIVTYAAVGRKTQPRVPPTNTNNSPAPQCSPIVDQNQNHHSSLPNITVAAHLKVEPPAHLEATVGEDSLLRCQVAGNNIFWERIFIHIMQYFLGENIHMM